jgi:hypothetical protein
MASSPGPAGYTTTTPIPGPVSCCSVPGAPRATATCDAMKDFSCHRNVGGDAQHMHMHMRVLTLFSNSNSCLILALFTGDGAGWLAWGLVS